MRVIDHMNEELDHLRKAAGHSAKFDHQLQHAQALQHRAVLSVRGGERPGFLVYKFFRSANWLRFEFGHKLVKCTACNGSGYYDNDGSPDCGACDGSGKDREPGEHAYQTLKKARSERI